MQYFLDEPFDPKYADMAASVTPGEYHVEMMATWYSATALGKQHAAILPCFERKRIDGWTHNKAIRKDAESRRLSAEQKAHLKTVKIGKPAKH